MQLYIIFIFIIAFFVAFLAWQNADLVVLSFLSWEAETPLIVVIIGAAAVGSILMGIVGALHQFKLKMKIRGSRRSIDILEKKVSKLDSENKRLQEQVSELEEELTVAMANERDQEGSVQKASNQEELGQSKSELDEVHQEKSMDEEEDKKPLDKDGLSSTGMQEKVDEYNENTNGGEDGEVDVESHEEKTND